jgi:hypothetical protein
LRWLVLLSFFSNPDVREVQQTTHTRYKMLNIWLAALRLEADVEMCINQPA